VNNCEIRVDYVGQHPTVDRRRLGPAIGTQWPYAETLYGITDEVVDIVEVLAFFARAIGPLHIAPTIGHDHKARLTSEVWNVSLTFLSVFRLTLRKFALCHWRSPYEATDV